MLAPLDTSVITDFVNNFDRINALAEKNPEFIWRLAEDNNNATAINIFDNEFLIVNMSVWDTKESLFNFTDNSAHVGIFISRKEWFSEKPNAFTSKSYFNASDAASYHILT